MAFERSKEAAAAAAVELVEADMVVGLGTGSTSLFFLRLLAAKVRQGLPVVGVPTSEGIAREARHLGFPLVSDYPDFDVVDLAVDGADEVDPRGGLIKGGGGALLREKLVAVAARRFVVMVDASKQVERLGQGWAIPVEVVPFGWSALRGRLEALGASVKWRQGENGPLRTDQGNYVFDCHFGPMEDPAQVHSRLLHVPGVVETGLFLGMTHTLLVGSEDGSVARVDFSG